MVVLVDDKRAPCVVLRCGSGGFAERSVSAAFGGDGEAPACELEGVVMQRVRAGAGADGMMRAGLLVPLGRREYDLADWGAPDVVSVDDWEEDDDMVDDDDEEEEEEEEEEDDELFPDDTDDFEDDEDSDEDDE